jgi:hypothetical protein
MKLIECYHPPINKIHLSNKIMVSEEKVFEYTKDLYRLCLESIRQAVEDAEEEINQNISSDCD